MQINNIFYSVQAEGISAGVPAVFIRLSNCNLHCTYCDSSYSWENGKEYTNEEILFVMQSLLEEYNLPFTDVLFESIHLVWTGGEPSLQQKEILSFLKYVQGAYGNNCIFNELETNGTVKEENDFYSHFEQINCSPKLSSSGVSRSKRIKPKVIQKLKNHKSCYFKFVISTEEDIVEMDRDYIQPFNISSDRVILMPQVDNRDGLPERMRFIFEMSKKYLFRSCSRLQILAYDRERGV